MSMTSQNKGYTSKNSSTGSAGSSRLFQNYPTEPIGSRPSYVGELVSLLRDGTQEIQSMLETECDLRFNCKVCGSILPSSRAFIIHKRQFCVTKFIEYTRRNVAMMERISNVVSFETRGFQTDDDVMDIVNPCNARLLIPLPEAQNGVSLAHPPASLVCEEAFEDGQNERNDDQDFMSTQPSSLMVRDVPAGVEVIEPSRPPADGLYKFGQGGMNLLPQKRKKHRLNTSSLVRKKKKKDLSQKKVNQGTGEAGRSPKSMKTHALESAGSTSTDSPAVHKPRNESMRNDSNESPYAKRYIDTMTSTRSKRLGPSTNGLSLASSKASSPAISLPNGENGAASATEKSPTKYLGAEQNGRDVRDPMFIRKLLVQLDEVADYVNKTCRECNRVVVSIYNLDRHVATQHLGLRESEYSLISRELRRLRSDSFPSTKGEPTDSLNSSSEKLDDSEVAPAQPDPTPETKVEPGIEIKAEACSPKALPATASELVQKPKELTGSIPVISSTKTRESSPLVVKKNGMDRFANPSDKLQKTESPSTPIASVPTTSKSSEMSDTVTDRLAAIIRNPNMLKEILTTKEKEPPHLDYGLDDLVGIQRQIYEAADPYLQCCRLCNKQYFDVYVLNRHVMTVHIRLPERSCGAINKMIKENMKRHPQAFEEQGIPVSSLLAPNHVGPHPMRVDQVPIPTRIGAGAADNE